MNILKDGVRQSKGKYQMGDKEGLKGDIKGGN